MGQKLLQNAYIISMNGNREVFKNADILIQDNIIVQIGKIDAGLIDSAAEIVDLSNKIIMPGLINTHVHLSQQLGRGIGDDVNLLTWLHKRIWPYESNLTVEDSYISSAACCIELIRSGVTCFAEAGGQEVDGMGKAVAQTGLRAALCQSTMDCGEGLPANWVLSTQECLDKQVMQLKKWHGAENGRIRYWFGLRTIFNNSDDLIVRTKQLADSHAVGVHMHVAEIHDEICFARETRGATTVEHLHNLGVLDKNFLAVHTVWLTDREIDLFKLYDVKVSHNPAAAMRVLGFARVPEMMDRGIPVSIGTDGAPSNNRMDMMDEMYLTSLIHKGRTLNPLTLPAERVLEMATVNGAKSMLWDNEIGSLEIGKKADLIVLNPDSVGSLPLHDPVSNIVYSMHASNVESSMCDGIWLMRDRKVLTIDEDAVIEEVKFRSAAILHRAGVELPNRFPVIDCK